jgi:hypothetical protein
MTGPLGDLLVALDTAPPFAALAVVTATLRRDFDAQTVSLLLADYGERTLERLDEGRPMLSAESLSVADSPAGRVFRTGEILALPEDDAHRLYLPVSIRADRLGVLDIVLPAEPDEAVVDHLRQVATTLAYVIASSRPYTDVFERVRRYKRLALAAEIQWGLLPALAYEGDAVSLSGTLEPAYEFGGDNFDYSIEEGSVTLSVTDSMGHGLEAAVVGSLAVNALRNARRSGLGLVAQAEAASAAILSQFRGEQFVSGLLARVDLGSGRVEVVDAGHPPAYLVRGGAVQELTMDADFPLGMFEDSSYRLQHMTLEPGDRVVVVSDGVLEAKPEKREPYGIDRLVDLMKSAVGLPTSELVRLVTRAVVEYQAGELRDDATVVCLDWRG